jgi:hypothetical protein
MGGPATPLRSGLDLLGFGAQRSESTHADGGKERDGMNYRLMAQNYATAFAHIR